jgi:histidinol-phosphate aminotransferase
MEKLWRDKLRKIAPYVPGDQPKVENMIKINTNENAYPPSPKLKEALSTIDPDKLKLYPDPWSDELVSALADYHHLDKDQIFVGNGSDEVLALAFLTFFNSDKEVLFPDIGYSFYPVYGNLYNIKYRQVPVDENFKLIKEDYLVPNGGIIFANPNAPTSIDVGLDFIEDILKANRDVIVIIDEAYVDFGAESAVKLIERYDNLLVIQTYSKFLALAGIRLGVALGSKELIDALKAVKDSFNSYPIDTIAQTLATAAIKDVAYSKDSARKIINTRDYVTNELRNLGFILPDSKTNFLFVTHPELSMKELFEALKQENIFVRYFNSPRISNHLRITIGTDKEMEVVLGFIRNYVQSH